MSADPADDSRVKVSQAWRISIFDFRLDSSVDTTQSAELTEDARDSGTGLWASYEHSFEWVFYGTGHARHEPRPNEPARDPRLPQSLPGLQRFILPAAASDPIKVTVGDGREVLVRDTGSTRWQRD